jgi:hypothetical protein
MSSPFSFHPYHFFAAESAKREQTIKANLEKLDYA